MEHRIERGMTRCRCPARRSPTPVGRSRSPACEKLTPGMKRVAMQYSPTVRHALCRDGGCRHGRTGAQPGRRGGQLRRADPDVRSALDAASSSRSHLEAGRRVDKVRAAAFDLIRERTRNGAPLTEMEVKHFVREGFAERGPGHRSRPDRRRAMPTRRTRTTSRPRSVTAPIHNGDFVLLDMWAKLDQPDAVYYDITWTALLRRQAARRDAQASSPW